MSTDRPAFPVLAGQRGLATYRQLRDAGWSEGQIRHARSTIWQCPFPSVAAPHRGPLDAATLLTASALWAGPRAVLSGTAAMRELGLRVGATSTSRILYVVPPTGRSKSFGAAKVVRSAREAIGARRLGIATVAPAARALADAAVYERMTDRDLEALAIAVLQRGLSSPEELERELWQRPQVKVAGVRKGLTGFLGGAWSRPEVALRGIVDEAPDLPEMLTNIGLVRLADDELIGYPDGYFPSLGLVCQVHSRQHHQGFDDQGGDRWAGTVEKDSAYVAVGARLLGVSPWTLYAQPRRFLTRLRQTVALGPASPMPAVRVVPAPPRRRRLGQELRNASGSSA